MIYTYHIPYPDQVYTGWSTVHWNAIDMLLVNTVYTGIPLDNPVKTSMVHWTLMKNLDETYLHRNATGENLTILAYTSTPLEKISWDCPTLECHRRNSDYCSLRWNTIGGL